MADREFVISPIEVNIKFALQEVAMFDNSLHLLATCDYSSGLGQWIMDTRKAFTDSEWIRHKVAMNISHGLITLTESMTFPEYIEQLKLVDPIEMVTTSQMWMADYDHLPSLDEALEDEETYVELMRVHFEKKSEIKGELHPFDEIEWRNMYQYLHTPNELHTLMIEHLEMMWERFVKPEWTKRKATLEAVVKAHQQTDYSGMSAHEVIEAVTGRDMRGHFTDLITHNHTLILSPSPHVGPYIGYYEDKKNRIAHLFFRAQLPKGSLIKSSELSRSELLVRLTALSDDTRLRMLELLIEHDELCAQDFINLLELSQSSASRHLRQLAASGYITERRREVAKCYRLNTDRIEDTLSALRQFLVR